jgi:hypothetical protein
VTALIRPGLYSSCLLGLACGLALGASHGCGAAEACNLGCPDAGIADGNASISGIASIDAFFGAVVAVGDASASVATSMRAEMEALAISLEIEGAAGLDTDALAAAIQGEIEAQIEAHVEGSLIVDFQPPKCEASVEVAATAAASCDASVDPGELPRCEGSCQIDASAQADCQASGTLHCEGKAPGLSCDGTCTGTCELEAGAHVDCGGTCRGECDGTCELFDGEGDCAGSCEGTCNGTCELELTAGGSCEGSCTGSCEYEAPEAGCEGGATAKCEASAEANIECRGGCEGEVKPPEVSAECEAAVEARADASVECSPPTLDLRFDLRADLDATARAEFLAWLEVFRLRYSAMLAASAQAELVLDAIVDGDTGLLAAASGAVLDVAEDISVSGDLQASFGAGCALLELPAVPEALGNARLDLQASAQAMVTISAALGG